MNIFVLFQNKSFIYRGKEYERISDFSARLQNLFPSAQVLYFVQILCCFKKIVSGIDV